MVGPVGFVGLGNMGRPMVRSLASAGFRLRVNDVRADAMQALVEQAPDAIEAFDDLVYLARDTEIVITMLPDAGVVHTVVIGTSDHPGIAGGLAAGGLIVDMSSSAPLATQALGAQLTERGLGLIDAPVSGGVARAAQGSLTIMAGGDANLVTRAEPILSAMGTVQRTGGLGSGHATKALNNYVSAAGLIAVCEALIIAERFGLDPHVVNGVLDHATGRNNTTSNKVEPFILNRAFNSGFALDLMRKDVGMARDLAAGLGLDPPWIEACLRLVQAASAELPHDADHTATFAYLERRLTAGA